MKTSIENLRWDLPLVGSSPKTEKGVPTGDYVGITYITPTLSRCPWSSRGCRVGCLSTAGRGAMTSIQRARYRRGKKWDSDPVAFARKIADEARKLARAIEGTLYLRVNGTSDILGLASAVSAELESVALKIVQYDYTKAHPSIWPKDGVHRTWSRSEDTPDDDIRAALDSGTSVAIVVDGASHADRVRIATARFGFDPARCIDGTLSDIRPLDPPGSLVILRPLGRARRDDSGFVIRG
jgi:hypothetical protein